MEYKNTIEKYNIMLPDIASLDNIHLKVALMSVCLFNKFNNDLTHA